MLLPKGIYNLMILSIERDISPQLCIINKYTLLNFMCQGNATASPYQ